MAIAGRLEISQQLATRFLIRLADLGYTARVEPIEPGEKSAGRGYWKILDPALRFWFRFIFPNRSRLAYGRAQEVAGEIKRDFPTFVGPVFEECCREWLARYSQLGDNARVVGSWWSRRSNVEVDVVTIGPKGYALLGSCKWSAGRVHVDVLDQLYEAKSLLGRPAAQARLFICARSGFSASLRERAQEEEVHLVGPDDLFAPVSATMAFHQSHQTARTRSSLPMVDPIERDTSSSLRSSMASDSQRSGSKRVRFGERPSDQHSPGRAYFRDVNARSVRRQSSARYKW